MTKIYTLLLLCLFALVLPVAGQEAEFKKIKESWTLPVLPATAAAGYSTLNLPP